MSLGNIYNYFENKDAIFRTLVSPTVDEINRMLDRESTHDYLNDPESWSYDYHIKIVDQIADFIDMHRNNLNLLAFYSHGSALESFKENLVERCTEIFMQFIKVVRQEFPDSRIEVSDFFVHNIVSFYIRSVEEILMHDIESAKMKLYLRELMQFTYFGWKSLMNEYAFSTKTKE